MNTLDGMIADLERDDTRIGGCTTAGEVVTMLKQLRDDAIVIPAGATNGDVIKALFKGRDLSIIQERLEHTHWWNASYESMKGVSRNG